ncbi:sigma-70 family RNA polymerase sigma factor [bacterium AH-315-G05]|nr:sigma-70 family RNA polymerase sigma factor [bacterium AH-315-G05]
MYDRKFPKLTREEERALSIRIENGDKAARDEFICRHIWLVKHFARKLFGNFHQEDLIQAGIIAMIETLDKVHNYRGKCRFSTIVEYRIKAAFRYEAQKKKYSLTVSGHKEVKILRARKALEVITSSTDEEVAASIRTGLVGARNLKRDIAMLETVFTPLNLTDEDEGTYTVVDKKANTEDDAIQSLHREQLLAVIAENLSQKQMRIVTCLYGLDDGIHYRTHECVAKELGIKKRAVSYVVEMISGVLLKTNKGNRFDLANILKEKGFTLAN